MGSPIVTQGPVLGDPGALPIMPTVPPNGTTPAPTAPGAVPPLAPPPRLVPQPQATPTPYSPTKR
jgi:hypothetical protein